MERRAQLRLLVRNGSDFATTVGSTEGCCGRCLMLPDRRGPNVAVMVWQEGASIRSYA
jgi:hypothetical protein